MTRYLVVGASGMLGRDIQRALDGREMTALGRADLDVTDVSAVHAAVAGGHDVVINCAAYTKVDEAESHEAERMRSTRRVSATCPRHPPGRERAS